MQKADPCFVMIKPRGGKEIGKQMAIQRGLEPSISATPRRHDRCGSREQDQGGLQWRQKSLAGQDVVLGLCLEL